MTASDGDAHVVFEVLGRSRAKIRAAAAFVRTFAGISVPYLPIVEMLEFGFGRPDFKYTLTLDVRENRELGGDHARWIPGERTMLVRQDVYEGACQGNGRDRLTLAHELGHALLHPDIGLARRVRRADIPPYRSSEWQATCFAGELLMPVNYVNGCRSIAQAMQDFGVSGDAARYQINRIYLKEGLIPTELPDE